MSDFLRIIEAWVRRRGIFLPRAYLLGVLGVLSALVAAMSVPASREGLATVALHDFFLGSALCMAAPLFLCDPVRGRTPLWAFFHLVCLLVAGSLALFFLGFCDLLQRDDRAFFALSSCLLAVVVGRLYVADFCLSLFARGMVASEVSRDRLLSAYARMLDVDHARFGLSPPPVAAKLLLAIRERVLRILGLRRTRSLPVECAFGAVVDGLASDLEANPSYANLKRYASAMRAEIRLHQVVLASAVGHPEELHARDVAERWPSGFFDRWTLLCKAYQRCSSRSRGSDAEANLSEFRLKVMIPMLESARSVMMVVHASDASGDKDLASALAAFRIDGRVSTQHIRSDFDRAVLSFRRPGVTPRARLAFLILAHAAAEAVPSDYLAVYGNEVSGEAEWKRNGLPPLICALFAVIAYRRQVESGGLTTSQSGPVFARLVRASVRAGFDDKDYPEAVWGASLRSSSMQWDNFAQGLKPHVIEARIPMDEKDEPGVGRISIANAFAVLVVSVTLIFFTFVSPFWLSKQKVFHDLFGPFQRAHTKARSIDLASDGESVAVATRDQGLLTIDVRNYGVSSYGLSAGLSSVEISDVVALKDDAFALSTEGLYGSKGLDFFRAGRGSALIGLPDDDHTSLTSEAPLTMVNVGKDALFVFRKGLLYYDANRRVLVSVPGAPTDIINACGSKLVEGRAWLLCAGTGTNPNVVREVVRDSQGRFSFIDLQSGVSLNPSKIFHDGVSLWCVDRKQAGVFMFKDGAWKMRAGSPPQAKADGGVATAEGLVVSRRSSPAMSDVLWMVKAGKIFARPIPHDPMQAELPWPWKELAVIEKDYLGQVYGFALGDVGYLVVPYVDKVVLITYREPDSTVVSRMLLPKSDTRLRAVDVGAGEVALATADSVESQVYLVDHRSFCMLAQDQVRAAWPSPVQSSAFLSEAFKLDDIFGVCKVGSSTYQFDSKGRWLRHDTDRHGLVNSGRESVPVVEPAHLLERMKGVRVRTVTQSADGEKALIATNYGLHEVLLGSLGTATPKVDEIVTEPRDLPALTSTPFGVSDTMGGPEVYFSLAKEPSQSEADRKLAHIWRLNQPLRITSTWVGQPAGDGATRIFADTLTRVRIDLPGGDLAYGAPIALNENHRLIFRDLADDVWKTSSSDGVWTDVGNASGGGTAIRQRGGDKSDGDVTRISQLIPAGGKISERPLWISPRVVPKGSLLNSSAVVPVMGRGFVFPTDEGFWSYDPFNRGWSRLMGKASGKVESYRLLSDDIRHASGAAVVSWWADDASNVYGVGLARAAQFDAVGRITSGVAMADSYFALNEGNALHSFDLNTGATRKLFAPISPMGGSSPAVAVESGERGLTFLPAGGGRVMTLDDDDRFVADKGPVMKSIFALDGRIVGLSEIKGVECLVPVFAPDNPVGSGLVSAQSIGDSAIAMSASGAVWRAGFSDGVLEARIIGNHKTSEPVSLSAKLKAAYSFGGALFVSADKGVHYRPDFTAAGQTPGFHKISWADADWFEEVAALGGAAPAGGLGCFSVTDKVEFSLVVRDAKEDFKVISGLDVPVFGPGGMAYRQAAGGCVAAFDENNKVLLGGATSLGRNAKVHPFREGVLVLSRAYGAGISYYRPSRGTDEALGFVRADGTRIARPFGAGVDFLYVSSSPADLPLISEGPILGRVSAGMTDVEVLSENAKNPVARAGVVRWLENGNLMGTSPAGGTAVTKEQLPATSASPAKVTEVHVPEGQGRLDLLVDGLLVEADLSADTFKKVKAADSMMPYSGGVLAASRASDDTWILSDGTVPLPGLLKEVGATRLGVSAGFVTVFDPFSEGAAMKVRAVPVSGTGAAISFSCRVAPRSELLLADGTMVQLGRRLFHASNDTLLSYDLDRGEWSEPSLPSGFKASSLRRHKDGSFYAVDGANGDAVMLQAGSPVIGEVAKGKAYGISKEGALVQVGVSPDGLPSLRAGLRPVRSGLDDWPRQNISFTPQSLSFTGSRGDVTLLAESPSAGKVTLYVKTAGLIRRMDLELPVPFASVIVCERPDGFILTDMETFAEVVDVSPSGDVSLSQAPYAPELLGRVLMPSKAPDGWIRVADSYFHRSGYESGKLVRPDSPVRIAGQALMVSVRRVLSGGISEVVDEVEVACPDFNAFSVIHPDFEKMSARDFPRFEGGLFYADFDGKRLPVLPRKVSSMAPAKIDLVRQLAVTASGQLCQLDGQGGLWLRDPVSGLRKYLREVDANASFAYARRKDGGGLVVMLRAAGRQAILGGDGQPEGTGSDLAETAASVCGFSVVSGALRADARVGGFDFKLSSRYPVGISADGWVVPGAASVPKLRHTVDGEWLLEFVASSDGAKALLHVPAVGGRRFMSARLVEATAFSPDITVVDFSVGGFGFSQASGALSVSCAGVSGPIPFLAGGGIEPDHYQRFISVESGGVRHLVNVSTASGRVYVREWLAPTVLGLPRECERPRQSLVPDLAVSFGGNGYLRSGGVWSQIEIEGARPRLVDRRGSPVTDWGELRKADASRWAFEGGVIKANTANGWEVVPCSSDPLALAFDQPSASFSDYRSLGSGRIAYRSRQTDGRRPIWYAVGKQGGMPARFNGGLPAEFSPQETMTRLDSLGNELVFSRKSTSTYGVGIKGASKVVAMLELTAGGRLPHLGTLAEPVSSGGHVFLRAGKTSSLTQLYVRVSEGDTPPVLTLTPPSVVPGAVASGPANWWIKDGKISVSWDTSRGLLLGIRQQTGLVSSVCLGTYTEGRAFEVDDPARIVLRDVRAESIAFSLGSAPDSLIRFDSSSLGSLVGLSSVEPVVDGSSPDVFGGKDVFSQDDLRPVEVNSGRLNDKVFSSKLIGGSKLEVRQGLSIPLHKVEQLGGWSTPQGDVTSALRLADGRLVLQSSGGAWLSLYAPTGELLAGRFVDKSNGSCLGWSKVDKAVPLWGVAGKARVLSLPSLALGKSEASVGTYEIEGGLSLVAKPGKPFKMEAGEIVVDPSRYPSVDIMDVSLAGETLRMQDFYGVRSLVSGHLGKFTPGKIHGDAEGSVGVRPAFGQVAECGAWAIHRNEDRYDLRVGARPLLDPSGVPFPDTISDFDGYESSMTFEHAERLVVMRASAISDSLAWGVGPGEVDRRLAGSLRLAIQESGTDVVVDLGQDVGLQYDVGRKVISKRQACRRPLGFFADGLREFYSNDDSKFEMRQRLAKDDRGPAEVRYAGPGVFYGNQLATDHVSSVLSQAGALYVRHPASAGQSAGWLERIPSSGSFIIQPIRERDGPSASVKVAPSMTRPWSELRFWGVSDGGVSWREAGARWGD